MIEFHPVTLKDREWVDRHVQCEDSPSSDFNFSGMFMWTGYNRQQICDAGERTLSTVFVQGAPVFVYPVGSGPLRPAISALREYAAYRNRPFVMYAVTLRQRKLLEDEFPGCFTFREVEEHADYIYEAEKLASLAGRGMKKKRNLCNRFEAEHDWRYVPLTRELIPACEEMLMSWCEENAGRLDASIVYEREAVMRAFQNYEQLNLDGGVLFVDGKLSGFSFGEMTNSDTFDYHVEKASMNIKGAYTMVHREFIRMLLSVHPNLKWINCEEDLGIEQLRQAKLNYKPAFLLRKYAATWVGER